MKMGSFVYIKICVLIKIGSLSYYKSIFWSVHIFPDIQETWITRKYVQQRENIYIHSSKLL